MKYELRPWNRGKSDDEILADLQRVASMAPGSKFSSEQYKKHGKFNLATVHRRFGSLSAALKQVGLVPGKRSTPTAKEALDDLKRVTDELGVGTLTTRQYDEHGRFNANAVAKCHGGWLKALAKAGLAPSRTLHVTDREWFENIARVWEHLGRQPSYGDMSRPPSRYSPNGYAAHFGGWRRALDAFVTYMESEHPDEDVDVEATVQESVPGAAHLTDAQRPTSVSGPRNPNYRLRYLVLRRDGYTCRACGKSAPGVVLEVDHIVPWPHGKTVLENLQALCQKCNSGKSNLAWTP